VVVLSVVPEGAWISWGMESGTLQAAAEYERHWRQEFERFLEGSDFDNIAWRKEIRTGVPDEQITAVARDCCADVIVMGSTGRSGLARMLMGSVTRRVLHHLPCSLLSTKHEDVIEELLEGDIRAIKLLLAEGRETLAAERLAEAAAKFRQVLLQNPFDVTALEFLAEAYAKLGRIEEAARYRRRAAALHHDTRRILLESSYRVFPTGAPAPWSGHGCERP
jgi:universal stress protein E